MEALIHHPAPERMMPELTRYAVADLPPDIKCQINSFIRIQWPWIFNPSNRLMDLMEGGTGRTSFVIAEQGVLISHAEVNQRVLTHQGESYRVYGVGAVMTYPAFRREGFGAQVVAAATAYIKASDADFALLFTSPDLASFYEGNGWEVLPGMRITVGPADAPIARDDEFMMGCFVTERGRQARASLLAAPLYVGPYQW
jgi:GNAT superfamily N-acetyltransferase